MSQYSFESQAEADYRLQWPEGNAPEIDEISYTWQTVYEQLQEMTTENMLQDIQEKIGTISMLMLYRLEIVYLRVLFVNKTHVGYIAFYIGKHLEILKLNS